MSRSREEAVAAGIHVDDIQHNMKRRIPYHNYRDKGTYMLTLVVEGRKPLFGSLQGDGLATSGTEKEPKVILSPLGKAIHDHEIRKISAYYPMVEVWKLCIMPDHLHIIVRVKEEMPEGKNLGQVVRGFKTGCTRSWWSLTEGQAQTATGPFGEPKGTGAHTPPNPAATAPAQVPVGSPAGKRPLLFEKGYCDKILLRPGQLENWKRYLDDNPRRLAIKRQYPDYFTVLQHISIGEWKCQAGEKEVMREAMNRGYRLIFIRENGFPEFYKPSGESFTACSEGRLLQISPWEYHMQRKTISREQCLQLNRLAEEIAATPISI